VRERHCLDPECSCTDAWLSFTEVDLSGTALTRPLSFEVRIDLRNGRERRPPKRSPEVHALVREFLLRFPDERFQELSHRRQQQRAVQGRLEKLAAELSSRGELLCYSDAMHEEGGVSRSGRRFSFLFVHQGRDYLIEDYYCPRPGCDCRQVHVEFWERSELPSQRVDVKQRLMVIFTLPGEFERIEFCHDDRRAADELWRGWRAACGYQLEEFRRRYHQIKMISRRGVPSQVTTAGADEVRAVVPRAPAEARPSGARAGRNDPCPCGSGKKFKRCCARRAAGG
jgi:hypothetical protein